METDVFKQPLAVGDIQGPSDTQLICFDSVWGIFSFFFISLRSDSIIGAPRQGHLQILQCPSATCLA